MFSRFGTPKCKAFETFANEEGFMNTLSSPTHAQSNGKAEAAVKSIKKLLKKCGLFNDEFSGKACWLFTTHLFFSARALLSSCLEESFTTLYAGSYTLIANF